MKQKKNHFPVDFLISLEYIQMSALCKRLTLVQDRWLKGNSADNGILSCSPVSYRSRIQGFSMASTDNYYAYLKTSAWSSLRMKALQRAGFRCQICNSKSHLQVHHRVYPKIYGTERQNDLTALCKRCHDLFTFTVQKPEQRPTGLDSIADMVCPLDTTKPTQVELRQKREEYRREKEEKKKYAVSMNHPNCYNVHTTEGALIYLRSLTGLSGKRKRRVARRIKELELLARQTGTPDSSNLEETSLDRANCNRQQSGA